MSGSTLTLKDVSKAVTTDLAAFLSADKSKEHDSSRETIQQYLDRFVKTHNNTAANHSHSHHHASTPTTPSSAGGYHSSSATPVLGSGALGGAGVASAANLNSAAPSSITAPSSGALPSSTAAGQRHANELWYQSVSNNPSLNHPLPFAFHRLSNIASGTNLPPTSAPTSQNSLSGSLSVSGGAGGTHSTASGQTAPVAGSGLPSSPLMQPTTSASSVPNLSSNAPLPAQRLSTHLVALYIQHGAGTTPIANVASRMIVYLAHLLPFLTPHLVMADWWDRLIQPSLQGEIRLEKDSLKACRDLVVECMVRDHLLDSRGSGTGSILVAGDEEGQLDAATAMAAMPIPQFILRKYVRAAHRLNHRLLDTGSDGKGVRGDGSSGSWIWGTSSTASGHAGHGSGSSGTAFARFTSSSSPATLNSNYPAVLQEMEAQQRLISQARTIIRRKKDILLKNLEIVLLAYGGGIGRVMDFFSCLYTYFVGARYRPEILGLLCQFIRRQRVHLHQILATPLFDSLLLSLKYDTSPLIVSLGLMTLIMLMPRIPAALNERLPDLFLILSRILCWPRSRQQLMDVSIKDGTNLTGQTIMSFDEFEDDTLHSGISDSNTKTQNSEDVEQSADSDASSVGIEFEDIALYTHGSPKQGSGSQMGDVDSSDNSSDGGAMSGKDPSAKNLYLDEDLIKSRVQRLLKRHSLHADLLTVTPEEEMANKARWQKLEPMEIVAMCVGLDVWSAGSVVGSGPVLRSIEEDQKGSSQQESEEDAEDYDVDDAPLSVSSTSVHENRVSVNSTPNVEKSEQLEQPQANVSAESPGSELSQGTPIEILVQEDFFGPRAVRSESAPRIYSSTASTPQRSNNSLPSTPRTRTRSKEVKMSQILRNFATLRGLDQDELLTEERNNKSIGTSLVLRERRSSTLRSGEASAGTPVEPTASMTADHGDIPAGDSMAHIASAEASQDALLHPETVAGLVLQNQDYRKAILNLERDLLMAKNELNFELFLKQQHIQQISKVHRAHVLDASSEADRQYLYNTCRSLKAQLHETRLLLEKEKSELEKRRRKQTHWDTELKGRMQKFRDERKQLQFDLERLQQDINDTRQTQEIQERLLTDERKATFYLKNSIEDMSPKLKRLEEYEKRIEDMARQLVVWESEQNKVQEVQRQLESVVTRWQGVELLLASEKEEARILRNRVSQQSQILDDLRIQIALNDGHGPEDMPETPPTEYRSEEEGDVDGEDDGEDDDARGPRAIRSGDSKRNSEIGRVPARSADALERERSIHRKASSSLRHHSTALEMGWPTSFTRSNSSQQGFDQQRRAAAMQEFMAREKERWDHELQESHTRWSREAMRNQQLEDRILDLLGQLELAKAISIRQQPTVGGQGGYHGGNGGGHGGSGHGAGGGDGDSKGGNGGGGSRTIDMPSQPQNVPYLQTTTPGGGLGMHDHFETDTDDGGTESSEMIGRYSRQRHDTEDEDDIMHPRMRTEDAKSKTQPQTHSSMLPSWNSKTSKSKSRGKLERAPTDDGTYSAGAAALQTHLGSNTPNIFDFGIKSTQYRKSGDSSSTGGSSSAAKAASSGLFSHMAYARTLSHLSDGGSSDMTTTSDGSALGGRTRGERSVGSEFSADEAGGSQGAGTGHDTGDDESEAGAAGKKKKKKSDMSKADREREREKERLRLRSGTGSQMDASKMYRNVRMF
ncbi:hypothetical protein BGZ98_001701 [Dissophora globulifera]|nr:hypothetical protein BGZ98_001701 [Dissophora globulifera]